MTVNEIQFCLSQKKPFNFLFTWQRMYFSIWSNYWSNLFTIGWNYFWRNMNVQIQSYYTALYNAILRIARNFLETRENIKISTHPYLPYKFGLIFMGMKQKKNFFSKRKYSKWAFFESAILNFFFEKKYFFFLHSHENQPKFIL